MSNEVAIAELKNALRVANLPKPSDSVRDAYVTDKAGVVTAANMSFKVGYMETCINGALAALGDK